MLSSDDARVYFDKLNALRSEKKHLVKELTTTVISEPGFADRGMIDAKYARALRIQSIDREIDKIKRTFIKEVPDG